MDRSTDSKDRLWAKIERVDAKITEVLYKLQLFNFALQKADFGDDNGLKSACIYNQKHFHNKLKGLQVERLELVEEIRRENNYTNRVV